MELTEAQYIFADLILLKIPPYKRISLYSFMRSGDLLAGVYEKYTIETAQEISALAIGKNMIFRDFLLQEKYIEIVEHSVPYDMLTEKGIKAKNLGGHKQYLAWEAEEKKKDEKGEFPKKRIILYDFIKMITPLILGILIGRYGCNAPIKNNNAPQNNQQQGQIKKLTPSPPKPISLDKKDTAH